MSQSLANIVVHLVFSTNGRRQLTADGAEALRFQSGTLKRGQHYKYLTFVFTQEGVALPNVRENVLHQTAGREARPATPEAGVLPTNSTA